MHFRVTSKKSRLLHQNAIAERLDFAFETTLGGRTITALLDEAASSGAHVHVWYVGLSSADLHVARVRARVEREKPGLVRARTLEVLEPEALAAYVRWGFRDRPDGQVEMPTARTGHLEQGRIVAAGRRRGREVEPDDGRGGAVRDDARTKLGKRLSE